jgi:hypothetical protein
MSVGWFVAFLVAIVAFLSALGAINLGANAIWWCVFALAAAILLAPIEVPAFWRRTP